MCVLVVFPFFGCTMGGVTVFNHIGIDVSKATLNIHISNNNQDLVMLK